MRKLYLGLTLLIINAAMAQQTDTAGIRQPFQLSAGISLSPQMIFLGGLDAGGFLQAEFKPRGGNFSLISVAEIRNKFFHLPIQSIGFNGKDLRTIYSVNALLHAGLGYTFYSSKKPASNGFYVMASPGYFTFKDKTTTPYFSNTVRDNRQFMLYGLAWVSSKVNKKGKRVTSQFYLPIFGAHPLENLRNMTLKFGWSI